jgi:hypothetical protein
VLTSHASDEEESGVEVDESDGYDEEPPKLKAKQQAGKNEPLGTVEHGAYIKTCHIRGYRLNNFRLLLNKK